MKTVLTLLVVLTSIAVFSQEKKDSFPAIAEPDKVILLQKSQAVKDSLLKLSQLQTQFKDLQLQAGQVQSQFNQAQADLQKAQAEQKSAEETLLTKEKLDAKKVKVNESDLKFESLPEPAKK